MIHLEMALLIINSIITGIASFSKVHSNSYNEIAQDYKEFKEQATINKYSAEPLLFELIGDIKGKSVLDLACGEGIYSRKLKCNGAMSVIGVDISQGMIDLARNEEEKFPLGIEYIVADVATLPNIGKFDIVIGSYLLNYCKSPHHLNAFCKTVRDNLKMGGRFVGLVGNMWNDPKDFSRYNKYGFTFLSSGQPNEGDALPVTFFNPNGETFSIDTYFLSKETFCSVLESYFPNSLTWHRLTVTDDGLKAFSEEYWKDLLEISPVLAFEASRPDAIKKPSSSYSLEYSTRAPV